MFPWLSEYEFFRKEEFEQLFRKFAIQDVSNISQKHPIVQEIRQQLQDVEDEWARQDVRKPIYVKVTIMSDTATHLIKGSQFTQEEQEANSTHYDFVDNVYQIAWNPRNSVGLEPVLALWHEATHRRQGIACGFSTDEQKLIWIERTCNQTTGAFYWSRYSEMSARIHEAEAYMALVTTHKDHLSIADREQLLYACTSMMNRIDCQTNRTNIQELIQTQLQYLQQKGVHPEYLGNAFGKYHMPWTYKRLACEFLESDTATQLYETCLVRLQQTKSQLQQTIQVVQNDIKRERDAIEIERLLTLATKYRLPVLATFKQDNQRQITCMYDVHAEQYIQNCLQQGYNVAIATIDGQLKLVFDFCPIPREYSSDPQLREQWKQQHIAMDQMVRYEEPPNEQEHDARTHQMTNVNSKSR